MTSLKPWQSSRCHREEQSENGDNPGEENKEKEGNGNTVLAFEVLDQAIPEQIYS